MSVTTTIPKLTKFGSPEPDQSSKHEMFYLMSPITLKESLYMIQMITTSQNYGPERQKLPLLQPNPLTQIPTGRKIQSHYRIKKIQTHTRYQNLKKEMRKRSKIPATQKLRAHPKILTRDHGSTHQTLLTAEERGEQP